MKNLDPRIATTQLEGKIVVSGVTFAGHPFIRFTPPIIIDQDQDLRIRADDGSDVLVLDRDTILASVIREG